MTSLSQESIELSPLHLDFLRYIFSSLSCACRLGPGACIPGTLFSTPRRQEAATRSVGMGGCVTDWNQVEGSHGIDLSRV